MAGFAVLTVAAFGLSSVVALPAASAVSATASADDEDMNAVDEDDIEATMAAAATDGATVPNDCPQHPRVGQLCRHSRILLVKYHLNPQMNVERDCQVRANYPRNPGRPDERERSMTRDSVVSWRYNVDKKTAVVSLGRKEGFPHWGFIRKSCLGVTVGQERLPYWKFEKPKHGKARWVRHLTNSIPAGQKVPSRTKQGRSQSKKSHYWAKVDWTPKPASGKTVERHMQNNATLRDAARMFVIGNVRNGWIINATTEKRGVYTRVYVPSLNRWGWIELRG